MLIAASLISVVGGCLLVYKLSPSSQPNSRGYKSLLKPFPGLVNCGNTCFLNAML